MRCGSEGFGSSQISSYATTIASQLRLGGNGLSLDLGIAYASESYPDADQKDANYSGSRFLRSVPFQHLILPGIRPL